MLGIRPENMHDAALAPSRPASIIPLPVELREELGSEVHVHCSTEAGGTAPMSRWARPRMATAPRPRTMAPAGAPPDAGRPLDPRTAIREGQPAALHVDLAALHFFDPATGESLRG